MAPVADKGLPHASHLYSTTGFRQRQRWPRCRPEGCGRSGTWLRRIQQKPAWTADRRRNGVPGSFISIIDGHDVAPKVVDVAVHDSIVFNKGWPGLRIVEEMEFLGSFISIFIHSSLGRMRNLLPILHEQWMQASSGHGLENLNREIRRRTRVVGTFPDGNSALMLVCARLRHVAGTQWGNKKYMNMKHLEAALGDSSIA